MPGAGFALIGYPERARVAFLLATLMIGSLLVFSLTFWTPAAVACLLGTAGVVTYWVAELRLLRRLPPRPARGPLTSLITIGVVYLAALVAAVLLVVSVGSFVVRSDMGSRLLAGERGLYFKRRIVSDLNRGALIFFQASPESAWRGRHVLARILAVPGDSLSIDGEHYRLNGRSAASLAPTGSLTPVLEVPARPESITVPTGCYFVVPDGEFYDSRVLSWAREENIRSTRFLLLSPRAFLQRLD
jgi:hypothetical protein